MLDSSFYICTSFSDFYIQEFEWFKTLAVTIRNFCSLNKVSNVCVGLFLDPNCFLLEDEDTFLKNLSALTKCACYITDEVYTDYLTTYIEGVTLSFLFDKPAIKQKKNIDQEITRLTELLNSEFSSKAPKHIVDKEQEKLAELIRQKTKDQ